MYFPSDCGTFSKHFQLCDTCKSLLTKLSQGLIGRILTLAPILLFHIINIDFPWQPATFQNYVLFEVT